MRLPWYKSKTALVGTLIIGALFVLKTYASYISTQEQKHTVNRIESLHTIDPLYAKSSAKNSGVRLAELDESADDKVIEKQARSILASDKRDEKQKKLAQIYLASQEE